jgi:gluconolactonase
MTSRCGAGLQPCIGSARAPRLTLAIVAVLLTAASAVHAQRALGTVLDRKPDAVIDLRTDDGVRLVQGVWRYSDAAIVPADFRGPGADLKPTGPPLRTFDVVPKAGVTGFDDRSWPVVGATTLEQRRTNGRLSFGWFRIAVTIPERIGGFDPTGSTALVEIVVDDYAEVWVDGQLPRTFGQAGGGFPRGYNTPNRVVIARDARPGQTIQVAVLGINGPISDPPANYVWIRSATLDFFKPSPLPAADLRVDKRDPDLDTIVPADARLERVADGFEFIEGPVWVPEAYLLFSDPNRNTIYRYTPGEGVAVYRSKSGYTGLDIDRYHQPGSNGLTLDADGRLTINEHGNRRVTRLEPNGVLTVLADRFEGRRLNSPNDLVYRSDGTLYFSDPPFGLPEVFDDPAKELPWSGVFRVKDGRIALVTRDLTGPNGLAFSPDERYLYVGNWDTAKKVVMRYEVQPDGSVRNGAVFFDMTVAPGDEALDGLKVDQQGNVYVSGPGGLWILSPDGRHLGTLHMSELPANFAWGDEDGRTLYLTARTGLYRLRLNVPGIRPPLRPRSMSATQ